MPRSAVMQDEGWRPSITIKQIMTGIQVRRHIVANHEAHRVLLLTGLQLRV